MPICPTGSHAKSSTPVWLVVGTVALEFLITKRFPWIGPFLAFLTPYAFDAGEFCAVEPVDMPEWSPADLAGIFTGQSGLKLAQTAQHVLWYEFCECNSGGTPAPPVVNPPADLPVIQPAPLASCASEHGEHVEPNQWSAWDTIGTAGLRKMTPAGATSLRLTVSIVALGGPNGQNFDSTASLIHFNAAGTQLNPSQGVQVLGNDPDLTASLDYAVPPTSASYYVYTQCQPGGGPCPANRHVAADVQFFCGGDPTRLQPECCPPDPRLTAALERIETLVTLVQRQGVPFAYVPQGEDTGLSGDGELAVSGLLAVTVLLTTLPGHYGMAEGSPDALFDVGWVALGTADGFEAPRPIRTSPMFLRVGAEVTKVGYSLAPGVVATIKRHVREP